MAVSGGVYGGYEITRWQSDQPSASKTMERERSLEKARAAAEAHLQAEQEKARKKAQDRIAADEQRKADARRAAEERQRLAALPSDEDRTGFVRRIQEGDPE